MRRSATKYWLILVSAFLLGIAGCSYEERDWKNADHANSAESYQAFLNKHPSGKYSDPARNRLESILWERCQQATTPESCVYFLQTYPSSKNAAEATARIDRLTPVRGTLTVSATLGIGHGLGLVLSPQPESDGSISDSSWELTLTLATNTETLVLHQLPSTKYLDVREKPNKAHAWYSGGIYEVTGKKDQRKGAKPTILLDTIRFISKSDKAGRVKPSN